jgi:hypothetical protein
VQSWQEKLLTFYNTDLNNKRQNNTKLYVIAFFFADEYKNTPIVIQWEG